MEVQATRHEVEYMVELFKSEIESASRIAAGGLKLLQLHKTIGVSAIDQLTHFGTRRSNDCYHIISITFKYFEPSDLC